MSIGKINAVIHISDASLFSSMAWRDQRFERKATKTKTPPTSELDESDKATLTVAGKRMKRFWQFW